MPDPAAGAELLAAIRAERGYTLSFHELLARADPDYLVAYRAFYRATTLDQRVLTAHDRELVWVAILSCAVADVGTIHVERALAAGVDVEECHDAITLTALAHTWPTYAFAAGGWSRFLHTDPLGRYLALVERNRGRLEPGPAHLALLAAHAVLRQEEPFVAHLRLALAAGQAEAAVAEALTYLCNPVGSNALQWATDTWFEAVRGGRLPAIDLLGHDPPRTRIG